MRRFIQTLPGKLIAHLAVLSLVLPSLSLMFVAKAHAQLQSLPTWAVVEFVNKKGGNYGVVAAEAVASEFAKTGKYDVVPQETIKRSMETLSLQSPVTDTTSILRLAQDLRASTIVRGEVVDYMIRNVGGGKQATVAMKVIVIDAASGLPVNGAGLTANSTVRAGEVTTETLVAEAIGTAANRAVSDVQARALPTATVLNTTGTDEALINQGARSGFKRGQEVIIIRNREQVATAKVYDVDPDQAYLKASRIWKGIRPGDKVRAVFEPADVSGITAGGEAKVNRPRSKGNNAGIISIALVLGLGLLLFTGGNQNSQTATDSVTAEATLYPDNTGQPAVKISWRPNIFSKGNSTRFRWQVWRDDIGTSPVVTVPGGLTSAYDTSIARDVNWADFGGQIGGTTCLNSAPPDATATAVIGPTPGRAHFYRVELVYRLSTLDLPGGTSNTGGSGGTGGTAGTTGGTAGTTGGTAGTTGGTAGTTGGTAGTTGGTAGTTGGNTGNTTGAQDCYFVTAQTQANGVATPLFRSDLQSPTSGEQVPAPQPGDPTFDQMTFTFNSVVIADPISVEYVVEVSSSPNFTKSTTKKLGTTISVDSGPISLTVSNNFFTTPGTTIWWRVGSRNTADKPGPTRDSLGERYIFSAVRSFKRPSLPPPPPAN